jgi:hypothetical protein
MAIERMVQTSSSYLIIVSPYLKLHRRLKSKMEDGFKKIDRVYFVYRANKLNSAEENWLTGFSHVKLFPVDNLHAKVYINEFGCVIASMNLYEYSQINNHELGVQIPATDVDSFNKVMGEVDHMIKSDGHESFIQKPPVKYSDFTSGTLFWELVYRWDIKDKPDINSGRYYNFCMWVKSKYTFNENELYRDGSCLFKATDLGETRFMELLKFLKKEHFLKPPKGVPGYTYE